MPVQENQNKKPAPLKMLIEWEAPVRLFKKRDREYFSTIGAIAFLLIIILLFLKEWLLIVVIIALSFVSYVLATVPPGKTKHRITNRGVSTGGRNYFWPELGRFWFRKKWGQGILEIETIFGLPRRLMLLLGEANKEEIKKILSDYLLEEKPEKAWMDRASDWLSKQMPLESK